MDETILSKVLTLVEGFASARSIKQKNRAVVELYMIKSACERISTGYKDAQIKAEVYELFPEYELKVEYQAPKPQTHIDATKLAKKLIKDGRIDDLLSIISISDKDLKSLKDGEELCKKHKVIDGESNAGVNVKKMTKEELKSISK